MHTLTDQQPNITTTTVSSATAPPLTRAQEHESLRIRRAHLALFNFEDPDAWQADLQLALVLQMYQVIRPELREDAAFATAFIDIFNVYFRLFEVRQDLKYRNQKYPFEHNGFLRVADVKAHVDKWRLAVPKPVAGLAEYLMEEQGILEYSCPEAGHDKSGQNPKTHVRLRADRILDALRGYFHGKYGSLNYK